MHIAKNKQAGFELIQLIELSRHGARAPFYDIWDYHKYWDVPLKTLSKIGWEQHYELGKQLRTIYDESIFSETYKQSEVKVESTSSERAQQSALSQLLGIYEDQKQIIHEDNQQDDSANCTNNKSISQTDYQDTSKKSLIDAKNLIPSTELAQVFQTAISVNRYVLEVCDWSSTYVQLKSLNFTTAVYHQFDDSLFEFKKEFIQKLDLKGTSIESITIKVISDYWDSVICHIYQKIPLPTSFTEEFIKKLQFVYDFQQLYINFNSKNGHLLKVQTTPFFKQIISDINDIDCTQQSAAQSNNNKKKFNFYSASDGNLNAVLISLGYSSYSIDFQEWLNPTTTISHSNPPFGAVILFEVYRQISSGELFVQVVYNLDQPIVIQGCNNTLVNYKTEFLPAVNKHCLMSDEEFTKLTKQDIQDNHLMQVI